jgi:hypothetical protein
LRDSASGTRTEVPKLLESEQKKKPSFSKGTLICCGYQSGDQKKKLRIETKESFFSDFFLSFFFSLFEKKKTTKQKSIFLPPNYGCRWLSQRVAMDDLASYFVEERSKVR